MGINLFVTSSRKFKQKIIIDLTSHGIITDFKTKSHASRCREISEFVFNTVCQAVLTFINKLHRDELTNS